MQCSCCSAATFQATEANWQGHLTDPDTACSWKRFPTPCTKLLRQGPDDSMWHDRWITVQGTAGCCASQACWDVKSPPGQSWLNLTRHFPSSVCSATAHNALTTYTGEKKKKSKVKSEPDMRLLGLEQLAGIITVFQVSQLVTNMIPQAMLALINSWILENETARCLLVEDYHIIGRCFFLFDSTKNYHH